MWASSIRIMRRKCPDELPEHESENRKDHTFGSPD
jgi:hypothetical protein